eukprot:gene13131-27761_t
MRIIQNIKNLAVVVLSGIALNNAYLLNNKRGQYQFPKLSVGGDFVNDDWLSLGGCNVLLPVNQRVPRSIVHFTGGFIAGSAVSSGYSTMLRHLALKGFMIVATAIPPIELNHKRVAEQTSDTFLDCYKSYILPSLGTVGKDVPIIGLGHSLGGKLMVISGSKESPSINQANIFLAFNNFGAKDSIDISSQQIAKISPELKNIVESISFPKFEETMTTLKNTNFKNVLNSVFSSINPEKSKLIEDFLEDNIKDQVESINNVIAQVDNFTKQFEFQPTPSELWEILSYNYNIKNNVIIQFINDDIDQSNELAIRLRKRGHTVDFITLPGTHITPNILDSSDSSVSIFLKELTFQLGLLSDRLWESTDRASQEKYYLPGSSGPKSGGVYLPGAGGSSRWDSDEY